MIAVIVLLILLLFLALGGLVAFLCACLRRDRYLESGFLAADNPKYAYVQSCMQAQAELQNSPHEDVWLTSFDGKKLHGVLFPNGQRERFVLMMHGYHSCPAYDFGKLARFYESLGYGLLLVTQRAHRESEGRLITYGGKEQYDCLFFCRHLAARYPACKIILHGISMGGATVMLAGALDLPVHVKGLIDDCGYSSAFDEIAYTARQRMHLPVIAVRAANLFSRLLTGVCWHNVSVPEAVRRNTLPKLFIHGEEDGLVPYEMGLANYKAAAGEKTFISVPRAGHAAAHLTDPEKVEKALRVFTETVFAKTGE
ncbi:MAG: alpha/beta hydrolase [Clostridiales bacterium]|nr:alpha/beta hydrolase [Clostridiales bacterium]